MKKLIPLLLAMALMLLGWSSFTSVHAQESAKEEKPTFYRLVPGVYVNGWPRFSMSYPKGWVEETPDPLEVFRVGSDAAHAKFFIVVSGYPQPFDKLVDFAVSFWKNVAKDVTVVTDKLAQLRDGTPAREIELQMVMNGLPFNYFSVSTKKGDMLVAAGVGAMGVRIGEDLKAFPYSLQYEPGKDEPMKVPPDVQEFLNSLSSAWVSHDLARVMTHYSDRYLNSGLRKGEVERIWRQGIGLVTSHKVSVTELISEGDKIYLAGFAVVNGVRSILRGTSIIKENGEWKWYGNQRDVSP